MKRALLATNAVVATIAVAGCGSGGPSSGTTTQTSAVVTWAGGVCSAATSYKTSLTHAGSTLKSAAPSRSAVEKTVGSVRDATQTFITSLQGLGKPGTAAGKQARASCVSRPVNRPMANAFCGRFPELPPEWVNSLASFAWTEMSLSLPNASCIALSTFSKSLRAFLALDFGNKLAKKSVP